MEKKFKDYTEEELKKVYENLICQFNSYPIYIDKVENKIAKFYDKDLKKYELDLEILAGGVKPLVDVPKKFVKKLSKKFKNRQFVVYS